MRRPSVLALAASAAVVLILAAVVSTGCARKAADSADSGEVILRTYSIPDGYDPEGIRNDLRRSLSRGDEVYGSVELLGDKLLVAAPIGIQLGVAKLVEAMAESGPQQVQPAPIVAIRYWAIVARPTKDAGGRFDGALAQAGELQPVLREIMSAQGPLEFDLLEQLKLASADAHASAEGRRMSIGQRVLHIRGSQTMADLQIQLGGERGRPQSIETRVRLDSGTSIVLAQTGFKDTNHWLPVGWTDDDTMLFYVISADVD